MLLIQLTQNKCAFFQHPCWLWDFLWNFLDVTQH
ncbi:Uncharacterised protein [Vibrio cholerae]|nr:Uncharacterised protein [Vibrio cholerae]